MLKYSSSINGGGISNITSAPQNTIAAYEKTESEAQCSNTQLDDGEQTASLTPHDKSVLLWNIMPLLLSLCNLAILNRILK
jgi:hypothetical protein